MKLEDLAPDGFRYRPDIVWFEEPVPMIEKAIEIVRMADIFIIVGTSLVVYPAAGLIHYAPPEIPKFIIDKNIPYTSGFYNTTAIEKPATEGVKELKKHLKVFLSI
jgi:NAD-dependent deacetylase